MDCVKIGPFAFRISAPDTIPFDEADRAEQALGVISYVDHTIQIRSDLRFDPQNQRVVLMHEVLHGLFAHLGWEMSEGQVDCLSEHLVELFQDNPRLARILTGEETLA